MDRSGSFERRSFSNNRVFGKREVIIYCVLCGREAKKTTRCRTMLVSSWREVGNLSRVERVDSQPVLGGSNELELVQELRYNKTGERERGWEKPFRQIEPFLL